MTVYTFVRTLARMFISIVTTLNMTCSGWPAPTPASRRSSSPPAPPWLSVTSAIGVLFDLHRSVREVTCGMTVLVLVVPMMAMVMIVMNLF